MTSQIELLPYVSMHTDGKPDLWRHIIMPGHRSAPTGVGEVTLRVRPDIGEDWFLTIAKGGWACSKSVLITNREGRKIIAICYEGLIVFGYLDDPFSFRDLQIVGCFLLEPMMDASAIVGVGYSTVGLIEGGLKVEYVEHNAFDISKVEKKDEFHIVIDSDDPILGKEYIAVEFDLNRKTAVTRNPPLMKTPQ
ncbi:hypothetical protein RFM68_23675 [Mesorhizobium sp. MSK_1335]|uniref:Uncharacterized protein n=1 Tax=Mesorhizobium montanum TaxID=3072323 RepID=A0ABU4ZTZ2_9HYPH|nr:hypothetical protein [Mesorhizobium sp. MSK_1335]MDX8527503.1 hypothetical protein [Mesorhizobium sp. MSK_1335]